MNVVNAIHTYLQNGRSWFQRSVSDIKVITVHHTASITDGKTNEQILQEVMSEHVQRGWPGASYHELITPDGTLYILNNFTDITWHDSRNVDSYAICLAGYFHPDINQQPTQAQLKTLKERLDQLCAEHPEMPADQDDVYGHGERWATACPGNNLLPLVMEYRVKNGLVGWGGDSPVEPTTEPMTITVNPDPVTVVVANEGMKIVNYEIPKDDSRDSWLPVKKLDFENMRGKCDKYDKMVENGYATIDDINERIQGLKNARAIDCSDLEEENRRLKEEISDKTIRIKTILSEWQDYVTQESEAINSGIKAEEKNKQLEEIVTTVAEKLEVEPEKASFFSLLKKLDIVTYMADLWKKREKAKESEIQPVKAKSFLNLLGVNL